MKCWIIYGGWLWHWMPSVHRGIALFPFILVRNQPIPDQLLRHERIHLQQQMELLILPFYIWYIMEYGIGRLKGWSHDKAYRGISFEREAFSHDFEVDYLQRRPRWAFISYLSQ